MRTKTVSIILPVRNEKFLQPTIDDIFKNAESKLEVIVVLDGYWPDPPLQEHENLIIVHRIKGGMRPAINAGAKIASGKYLMKLDGHCALDKGFDVKLMKDCEYNWLVVPRRYSLDVETWGIKESKPPIDHMFLDAPSKDDIGYKGKVWRERTRDRADILIDDLMTFQGSCWFMHKDYFWEFGGMDMSYGHFFREAQELGFRTWLSGGRCVRNKKTWYAHLHKGKTHGRMYTIDWNGQTARAVNHLQRTWISANKGPKQKYPLSWLMEKFAPIPGWEVPQAKESVDPLNYIITKYKLEDYSGKKGPIEIPNIGRDDLASLFCELGYKIGAEVGVEQGKYSEVLCKGNPNLKLYSVDAWKSHKGYRDHVSQEKLDGFYKATKERLTPFNCEIVRKFSLDAMKDFEEGSLDFVYIDANHRFEDVVQDIVGWLKRIRVGGIISGHDYRKDKGGTYHVMQAVQGYTDSYRIYPWFIAGLKEKKVGQVRDDSRSWFWVKI